MKIVRTIFLGFVAIAIGSAVSTQAATKHAKTVAVSAHHCSSSCKPAATHAGFGVSTKRVAKAKPHRVAAKPKPKEMHVIALMQGK